MTINRTNLTWSENNRVNRLLRRAKQRTGYWYLIRSIELRSKLREIERRCRYVIASDKALSATFTKLML